MALAISQIGLELIKSFEGCSLRAYLDAVGIWTIGYGHTGADVKADQEIPQAEADRLLQSDLERFEKAVNSLVKVALNQNQFDALVSLVFNIGDGAFAKSTLLRLLNAGDYAAAAGQFKRWNKAGGRELRGLTRRRKAEHDLFVAEVAETLFPE